MKISLLLGIVALGGIAQAQTPVAAPATNTAPLNIKISPEDQKKLDEAKSLMRTVRLWGEPVDWKETDASTASLMAHVRKALGTKAPTIEVRSKESNRSTFALEKAPLGPTLWALADFANVAVWVFPGQLVLAPESALTPEERTAIKDGLGGEWQGNLEVRKARWNPRIPLDKVQLSLVGNEIKARLAAKGITAPVPAPQPVTTPTGAGGSRVVMMGGQGPSPYTLPMSEFSPQAQEIMKELYDERYPFVGAKIGLPKTLPASTVVGFDDTRPTQLQLNLQDPNSENPYQKELGRWFLSLTPPTTPRTASK